NRWHPVSRAGAPPARGLPFTACLPRARVLVFGGFAPRRGGGDPEISGGGGIYDLARDRWTPLPAEGAPEIAWQHWNAQGGLSEGGEERLVAATLAVIGERMVFLPPVVPSPPSSRVLDLASGTWSELPA